MRSLLLSSLCFCFLTLSHLAVCHSLSLLSCHPPDSAAATQRNLNMKVEGQDIYSQAQAYYHVWLELTAWALNCSSRKTIENCVP